MKTYLLTSQRLKNRFEGVEALAPESHRIFHALKNRAILVTPKAVTEWPEGVLVYAEFSGNKFQEWKHWVESNIIDDLHAEFLQGARPTPVTRARAIAKYEDAVSEVLRTEVQLLSAKESKQEAARTLIRTFGKAPVFIDGEHLYPKSSFNNVHYVRDMGAKVESEDE